MNKSGIFTWFGFIASFDDKLKMIKDAGFETVCTWWGNEFSESDGDFHTHSEKVHKAGLTLEHAHVPYYEANHIWYDKIIGEELFAKYKQSIIDAKVCGVDTLVIHPFEKDPPSEGIETLCHDRFCRLGDFAGKNNIHLAIENLADNTALKKIIRFADNPYVGICFDSGHNNIVARDDFSLLIDFADRIHALHLHDNNATEDQHLLPYEGIIDWSKFIKTIDQTKYNKSFMLEASYPYIYNSEAEGTEYEITVNTDITPEQYLKRAFESCQKAMNLST